MPSSRLLYVFRAPCFGWVCNAGAHTKIAAPSGLMCARPAQCFGSCSVGCGSGGKPPPMTLALSNGHRRWDARPPLDFPRDAQLEPGVRHQASLPAHIGRLRPVPAPNRAKADTRALRPKGGLKKSLQEKGALKSETSALPSTSSSKFRDTRKRSIITTNLRR